MLVVTWPKPPIWPARNAALWLRGQVDVRALRMGPVQIFQSMVEGVSKHKTRHLSTHPGKRVILLLRDGSRVSGRFVSRDEQDRVVLDCGTYRGREISSMLVPKGATEIT